MRPITSGRTSHRRPAQTALTCSQDGARTAHLSHDGAPPPTLPNQELFTREKSAGGSRRSLTGAVTSTPQVQQPALAAAPSAATAAAPTVPPSASAPSADAPTPATAAPPAATSPRAAPFLRAGSPRQATPSGPAGFHRTLRVGSRGEAVRPQSPPSRRATSLRLLSQHRSRQRRSGSSRHLAAREAPWSRCLGKDASRAARWQEWHQACVKAESSHGRRFDERVGG